MPKVKLKKTVDKRGYLYIAIGILIVLFCLLLIGRVGKMATAFLFVQFIFGDFASLILVFITVVSLFNLTLNKKIDLHHIFFIGFVLIYLGLSLFCHLGLYEPLQMTNKNIITKTIDLYSRYLTSFDRSYTCGGGIIAAVLAQIIALVSGKIGIILVGIVLLIIGFSYIININIFKLLKGGKLKGVITKSFKTVIKYFKNIQYPQPSSQTKKIPISLLQDNDEPVSFTLQSEINKEVFKELGEYIRNKHITCILEGFETSYTSSRFIVKIPHKSDIILKELSGYFNKCCFFIKNNLSIYIEVSNQFKKLLTLKSLLMSHNNKNGILLGIDVDNHGIELDVTSGKSLAVIGDISSGLKTFTRTFLSSLLIKGHQEKNIYFYDSYAEFLLLNNTDINYINNEKSAAIAFDEAFSEYERRCEVLRYLNADSIDEANKRINEMGEEYEPLNPIFHFVFLKPSMFDDSLIQKLSYVMQFGVKVGLIIILLVRDKQLLFKLNLSNCDILAFHMADVSISVKLFGSDIACRLQKKGDVIYQSKDKIYHGQSPYISLDDFEKIIDHL
ncbi:MAG: hypothetical protein IJY14_02905 [Acholeplasmatales bacterium]|nr:hypothetical protein [Acholeplasmatales bacterium]